MTDAPERQRRANNEAKLLAYLIEHGSALNVELVQIAGLRFGARLHSLRKQGWCVVTEDVGRGLVRYTLTRTTPTTDGQQALFI